jgi:hypothetical protein
MASGGTAVPSCLRLLGEVGPVAGTLRPYQIRRSVIPELHTVSDQTAARKRYGLLGAPIV